MTGTNTNTEEKVQQKHSLRKWSGVVWLLLEVNLMGGTIFGFPAMFEILPEYGIYGNLSNCVPAAALANGTKLPDGQLTCEQHQTREYQNALTLGIILFEIPSLVIGPLIDRFGCRSVKLFAIIFHIIGWLALALVAPGRDALLYVHTAFSSLGGIMVLLTAYTSSNYFAKSRAFVSALFAGACTSATMWYSIFQVLIDNGKISLQNLSFIWMGIGVLMFFSAFLYLDWTFSFLNLPYQFNTGLEKKDPSSERTTGKQRDLDSEPSSGEIEIARMKWYQRILKRKGVWHYLTSPLYILVVMFLSVLLLPGIFLAVTWYPWVYFITGNDRSLSNTYTQAFNLSTIAAIVICPLNGFLLGFKADKSKKQKLFNIAMMQTVAWLLNVASCIVCMFVRPSVIIAALVINCIGRATIVGGSQAVVATFFPSQYIGTLTGVMWTVVGVVATVQYGLVQLTDGIVMSWRAWVIVLALVVLMSCHLVQLWWKYIRESRKKHTVGEYEIGSRF